MTWPGSWTCLPRTGPRGPATSSASASDVDAEQLGRRAARGERGQPQHPAAHAPAAAPASAATRSAVPASHARRAPPSASVVEGVGVLAQLVGGAGQGGGDPGPELVLEHRQHPVPHPDPGEPRVVVVRVVPALDALGPAGGLGLRRGSRRAAGGGSASKRAAHPGERPAARAAGQPEQHGLGLVVEGVAEQHDARRRSAAATSAEHGVPRLAGRRLGPLAAGRRRSTRTATVSSAPERGHLRDDRGRRARPSPSCSPWSTVDADHPPGRLAAPRRRWRRAARASRRRRSRRPTTVSPGLERRRARGARRAAPPRRPGASAIARLSRGRGATQAAGSPISALEGRFAGSAQTALKPSMPTLSTTRAHERGAVAVLRHLGVEAEQPAQQPVERRRRPCGAG